MEQYLYGAAVQGIQSFIFQTNKLKEIVGASELVERICTGEFAAQIGKPDFRDLESDPNAVINAAGNIKYIFDDEELLKKTFREFPMRVQRLAPGITISQAVVKMSAGTSLYEAVSELEKKLKTQRNRVARSRTLGLTGVRRSRTTGLPVLKVEKGEYLDDASMGKRDVSISTSGRLVEKMLGANQKERTVISDISEITAFNDWIAVVHIDGNNLGRIVKEIGKNKEEFHTFSLQLDKATAASAKEAVSAIDCTAGKNKLPLRPIVLGGDDFTLVIRDDLAIDFTKKFLEAFEKNTKEIYNTVKKGILKDGMTACAGIAFIKSSYPFYYGYSLAETLCDAAKKDTKSGDPSRIAVPSCLMFHKVQDSFIEDYSRIKERELTPNDEVSLDFGPYYLKEKKDYWTIEKLQENLQKLATEDGNAIKSHLRRWLTVLHQKGGIEKGRQLLERLKTVAGDHTLVKVLIYDPVPGKRTKYPVYDLMSLLSVTYHKTK